MLTHEQMTGRRKRSDRSPKATRVLEAVFERHQAIAGSPEKENRAANAVKIGTGIVHQEGASCGSHVGVLRRALQEAEHAFR